MNAPVPRLEGAIREYLLPHLRDDGFTGSGRTFRRVVNGWVQIVNVQGSRYGGEFAINLGLHPLAVPDVVGESPDPKKMTESRCEFRRRLTESGVDQWWKHDTTQASMDAAVAEAASVYVRFGRPVLARISQPNSPFGLISPEDLENDSYDSLGFGSTGVRMALVLARLRKVEGKLAESKAFARYGLARVGPAIALRAELEQLAKDE